MGSKGGGKVVEKEKKPSQRAALKTRRLRPNRQTRDSTHLVPRVVDCTQSSLAPDPLLLERVDRTLSSFKLAPVLLHLAPDGLLAEVLRLREPNQGRGVQGQLLRAGRGQAERGGRAGATHLEVGIVVDSIALFVVRRRWAQALLLEERLGCRLEKRCPLSLDIHRALDEEGGNDGKENWEGGRLREERGCWGEELGKRRLARKNWLVGLFCWRGWESELEWSWREAQDSRASFRLELASTSA